MWNLKVKPTVTHFQSCTNRTMKPSRPHIWEMSGVPVHVYFFCHYPSLVHGSAASCRKSRQREAFPPVLLFFFSESILGRFQFGSKTCHPAEVNKAEQKGGHCVRSRERPFPGPSRVLWTCFDSSG